MKKCAISFVAFGALSACYTMEPMTLSAFSAADAEYINTAGSAQVKGNAFLRQNGGGVVTCAGEEVWFMPATQYSDELIEAWFGSANYTSYFMPRTAEIDPAFWNYVKKSRCDSEGRFTFNDLSDGRYYVITAVRWSVPGRYSSNEQGGHMYELATITAGQDVDVIMSR